MSALQHHVDDHNPLLIGALDGEIAIWEEEVVGVIVRDRPLGDIVSLHHHKR
jgi:hypothetical protein